MHCQMNDALHRVESELSASGGVLSTESAMEMTLQGAGHNVCKTTLVQEGRVCETCPSYDVHGRQKGALPRACCDVQRWDVEVIYVGQWKSVSVSCQPPAPWAMPLGSCRSDIHDSVGAGRVSPTETLPAGHCISP